MSTAASPKVSEKELQEQICTWLCLHGWTVLEFAKAGGHAALRGAVPRGCPDLYVVKNGRQVWLEVKTTTGLLSLGQKHMHLQLWAAGAEVYIVRSPEEARLAVEEGQKALTL